jgi:hypothetical protein
MATNKEGFKFFFTSVQICELHRQLNQSLQDFITVMTIPKLHLSERQEEVRAESHEQSGTLV